MPRRVLALVLLLLAAIHAQVAAAQCEPRWLNEGPFNLSGNVHTMAWWDPDGSGPQPVNLVVGGDFQTGSSSSSAGNIARWDGQSWYSFGEGTSGTVDALAVMPDGALIAAGWFAAGPPKYIARWTGSEWVPVGAGPTSVQAGHRIRALQVMPDGTLIAAGSFDNAGTAMDNIARWNGTSWVSVGGTNGPVRCLRLLPGGDLLVGGGFNQAGGQGAECIARLSGSNWSAVGPGLGFVTVTAMDVLPGGDLVVADVAYLGTSSNPPYSAHVRRLTGGVWSTLSHAGLWGFDSEIESMLVDPDTGDITVVGEFTSYSLTPLRSMARWDGASWSHVPGAPDADIHALMSLTSGEVLVGLDAASVAGQPASPLAVWDGESWTAYFKPTQGFDNIVTDLAVGQDGTIWATGSFTSLGDQPASHIARWNGVRWEPLGEGLAEGAFDLLPTGNGVLAGGRITIAGSGMGGLARWASGAWTIPAVPLALGSHTIRALVAAPGGGFYVGANISVPPPGPSGSHQVLLWDGSQWNALGAGLGTQVNALELLPGGDLVAGLFSFGGTNYVARWDGATWNPMGAGFNQQVFDLHLDHDGRLWAVGLFTPTGGGSPVHRVARWTGSAWESVGSYVPNIAPVAIASSPGRVFVAGDFYATTGPAMNGLAMWDGVQWGPVGTGFVGKLDSIVAHPSGEIMVAGRAIRVADRVHLHHARYTFTNIPWIALHPQPFTTTPGQSVTLSATPATGYDNLTVQWQRETAPGSGTWLNLSDGPGGASPNGGTVINSSGTINGGEEALLSISGLALSDAGAYRCLISNPCGQDESNPAQLTITNPCPPDLTTTAIAGSPGYGLPNGTLNNDDFFYFLGAFAAGNVAVADLTTTAVPGAPGYGIANGAITNDDFFYYLTIFAAGC